MGKKVILLPFTVTLISSKCILVGCSGSLSHSLRSVGLKDKDHATVFSSQFFACHSILPDCSVQCSVMPVDGSAISRNFIAVK